MPDEADAVAAANARFYRALSNADLDGMAALWLHSPQASCIHPGWPMLAGWETIRDSWAAIFRNQGPIRIWPGEVAVHVRGETAWVTCIENIDPSRQLTDVLIQAQATNIFQQAQGQWRLVHHHASPLPQAGPGTNGGGISQN
jgi:uncharacterized protein (TIGR02246 family)